MVGYVAGVVFSSDALGIGAGVKPWLTYCFWFGVLDIILLLVVYVVSGVDGYYCYYYYIY